MIELGREILESHFKHFTVEVIYSFLLYHIKIVNKIISENTFPVFKIRLKFQLKHRISIHLIKFWFHEKHDIITRITQVGKRSYFLSSFLTV